jgi:hypothetical protein
MKLNCYIFLALLGLFIFPLASRAQILFDNGPVFNSVGTGSGGANESVLYTTTFGMGTIGFGQQLSALNRVADDFTLTATSQIDSIVLFAYQTNSTTTSTITNVNFRIWDGPPDSVGSNIVFGDTTTNRLTNTYFSNIYRVTETTIGSTIRPIMRNVCATPGLTLTPGIYWIDWQTGGSISSGPWQPARVPVGQSITGNGKQRLIGASGGVWNFAVDGGPGTPAQGFPFLLYGPLPATLSATSLTFPTLCVGANDVQSTTITGQNLTGSPVIVGPYSSFGFSTNPAGPFDPTVSLSYAGSSLSSVVYVQYLPLAAGNNNGNIPMAGGGATGLISTIADANSTPMVTATSFPSPAIVCEGSSVTLTGAGATTYTWTDGTNTPIDGGSFLPAASSTYTVTGTTAGCSSTATVIVTVNPIPTVTATATPSTTCDNTSVTPAGGGANSYLWSGGLTDNLPFIATAGSSTYTVTGIDGVGCSATSSVTVTVNPSSGMLAPATSNQTQNHGDDFNIHYYDASCNLIASVDDGSGGNILGLTVSTVNVDANAGVHNGQPFVRRWYQITPANNVGVSAMVTLYIDQADFTDYNTTVALPYLPMPTSGNNADPNISNIRVTKNADAGLGNSPEVITPAVNWNGMYWELTFPVTGFSQFRVHSANPFNAALPATITKFSGRKLNSSDLLEWTTASEQNNAYFNLQHSNNAVDFKTIAQVNTKAPNGNSQIELNYSFEHKTPSIGHNYYRLQQVDIDHQISIHAKVVDLIWGADGSTVNLYPNPTQDVLNIDLYTTKPQNTIVKVMDMSGRLVKEIQARSEAGMNTYNLNLAELASGLYTVQVYDNDQLSHVSKVKKN